MARSGTGATNRRAFPSTRGELALGNTTPVKVGLLLVDLLWLLLITTFFNLVRMDLLEVIGKAAPE